MIGEIGCGLPFGPGGVIAARTAVEVGGVVGLDLEVGRQRVGVQLGEQFVALLLAEVLFQFLPAPPPW